LKRDFIKIILTKDQERSNRDKEEVRIRKSRYIESDETHCCIGKFNIALSLYRVLGVAFYFSKSFLEIATEGSIAAKALQSLEVIMVCFLG